VRVEKCAQSTRIGACELPVFHLFIHSNFPFPEGRIPELAGAEDRAFT